MAHLAENFDLNMADAVRGKLDFKGEVPYPPISRDDNRYFEEIHCSNAYFAFKLLLEEANLDNAKSLVDVGVGMPFSVLGFKEQNACQGILESIGFGNVRTVRKYGHLFCEAVKPA